MFGKPMGGTELMYNELMRRLPESYREHFSIFNYISQADFSKITIYWNQLSYDQEAVQFLKDPQYIDKIDWFVFVSHWQAEQYRKHFGIPGYKTHVIENGCLGVEPRQPKPKQKLRMCYTSTPWRGLDVLLRAWEILQPTDCELHVFSSCKIYGENFAKNDSQYEELYNKCNTLPNVVYRGSIPNEELRKELPTFDMLTYPCTFEETSCIAVIEALSAGLRVVTSSIGALPETTGGWARTYSFINDRDQHAQRFAKVLIDEVERMRRGKLLLTLQAQTVICQQLWNWDVTFNKWQSFLSNVIISKKKLTIRNSWDVQILRECYIENEYNIGALEEKDVVIDLGGHIGSFSLLAYDKGSRNIHTFEPGNDNFSLLEQNIPHEEVVGYKLAVWRSDKDVPYIKFNSSLVDFNTSMGKIDDDGGEDVECIKLDDVLSKFESVRLIKIDIEGAEYGVLYTSKQLDKVKEIVGEFHEYEEDQIDEYTFNRNGLKKFLEDKGYDVLIEDTSNKYGFFKALK